MTREELERAVDCKLPVTWRGRSEQERVVGAVTALIVRSEGGKRVLSCEITSYRNPRSVVICRPEEVCFWRPSEDGEGSEAT